MLFHLLVSEKIDFDIIIVNYNTRKSSIEELEYAKELANKNNKKIYIKEVDFSKVLSNFENEARNVRHNFFKKTIKDYDYNNLITGHNLNDKVEWFLMQMTKGAGTKELFGMEPITKHLTYTIVRPLLGYAKEEITEYLQERDITYFVDESNDNTKYKRNLFRKNYSNDLVKTYAKGLKSTFDILGKEVENMDIKLDFKDQYTDISYFKLKADPRNFVRITDKFLKEFGYVMSSSLREELNQRRGLIITYKKKEFAITYNGELITFTKHRLFYFLNDFLRYNIEN